MAYINQLPLLMVASPGDQIPVYTPNNGDARRLPIGALLTFFQQNFASPTLATNVYTPGTGFNVAVKWPHIAPKQAPKWPKMAPRWLRNGREMAHDGPRTALRCESLFFAKSCSRRGAVLILAAPGHGSFRTDPGPRLVHDVPRWPWP